MDKLLKAIANDTRLNIMVWLSNPGAHFNPKKYFEGQGVCVGLIQKKCKLSQPATSQHLAVLEKAGLVRHEKRGAWRYYYSNQKTTLKLITFLNNKLLSESSNV